MAEGLPTPRVPVPERRFSPEAFEVHLSDFSAEDQRRLRDLYQFAQGAYTDWLADDDRDPTAALERIRATDLAGLRLETSRLGSGTDSEARLRPIIHDVRSGTVAAFLSLAELLLEADEPAAQQIDYLQQLIWLVRDEAKIMRATIVDIDSALRDDDLEDKPHGVADLVRKWNGMQYTAGTASAQVTVHDELGDTALASRCLEAATIDRIAYNLLNNAVRFSADGAVGIHLDPVGDAIGRITVENRPTEEEVAWLKPRLATDPLMLFRPEVTHGGTGIGLVACAELVGAAFQLTPSQAVRERVIGYTLTEGRFLAWFCWPVATAAG